MGDRRATPNPLPDDRLTLENLDATIAQLVATGMMVRIGDLVFLTEKGWASLSDNDV